MKCERDLALATVLVVLLCGCAVHEANQGLVLKSAEEANVLQEELVAIGFAGAGHSDGDGMNEQGIHYAVAGYHYVGEYDSIKTEVDFEVWSPPPGSELPVKRSVTIRCWSRGNAEAASLRLLNELKERVQKRMADEGSLETLEIPAA
jgi:hypothetical protein